ncbi:DUF4277 domain-containing protein [bacterium]|nr:DUF4277 domain-containing protein [bacterium]
MGEEIAVYKVDHLPIVRKYAEKIGVMEIINRLVSTEMEIEPGDIALGMILDTLSGRSPLYRLYHEVIVCVEKIMPISFPFLRNKSSYGKSKNPSIAFINYKI